MIEIIVKRFPENPIIYIGMDKRIGSNVNGPSLIRVPEWVDNPMAKYYLYFAHHKGTHIRLAYANRLQGPWKIYTPGVLELKNSFFRGHIASPDVCIDENNRIIRMYYHGSVSGGQRTRVAISNNGIDFSARREILGKSYFRVFSHGEWWYALAMPGRFYRSNNGLTGFERGHNPFFSIINRPRMMRHSAINIDGDILFVFYSCIGDCPERILMSTINLSQSWKKWKPSPPATVLRSEKSYEGAHLVNKTSKIGWARTAVHQLRDPAIYVEDKKTYLLYSAAGEQGIAIAELEFRTK